MYHLIGFLLGTTTIFATVAALGAEVYPAKGVRIVVPFAAGGSTDILARNVAQGLNEAWKQAVVVDNRAGGGGIVGSEHVAKSPADGYTLLLGTVTTHAVAATLYSKLPYDIQRDFAPITEIATVPQLISVHPSIPVKSLKDLVAFTRSRPSQLNYDTAGNGSASHMAMELFQSVSKTKMVHVPYKGTGPAMTELLGGHLSLMFDAIMTSIPHVRAGRLRTLATSGLQRQFHRHRMADGVGAGGHQQGVAIGGRFGCHLGADLSTGAGAVIDHDGLAQCTAQSIRDQTADDVG